MWAWIGVATAVSDRAFMTAPQAEQLAKLTAFCAIGIGGIASAIAGRWADRIGKAEVAIIAMVISGASALLAGATFGGPVWLTFLVVLIWAHRSCRIRRSSRRWSPMPRRRTRPAAY